MIGDTENFVLGMMVALFGFWFGFSIATASAIQLGLFVYRYLERRWHPKSRAATLKWRNTIGLSSMLVMLWGILVFVLQSATVEMSRDFDSEASLFEFLIYTVPIIPSLIVAYPLLTSFLHLDKQVTLWLLGGVFILLPLIVILGIAIGVVVAYPIVNML